MSKPKYPPGAICDAALEYLETLDFVDKFLLGERLEQGFDLALAGVISKRPEDAWIAGEPHRIFDIHISDPFQSQSSYMVDYDGKTCECSFFQETSRCEHLVAVNIHVRAFQITLTWLVNQNKK